jgi:hypothetical protein
MNMDTLSCQIVALLSGIFQCEPQVQEEGRATVIRIENPSGGLPLLVTVSSWNDIRVQPGKTPRYYPADDLTSLEKDLQAYAAGQKVVVDAVDVDGHATKEDRFIKLCQLDNLDAAGLWQLAVDIGLIGSQELDHLLLTGGKFRVQFWDAAHNFIFKYKVDKLIKVPAEKS